MDIKEGDFVKVRMGPLVTPDWQEVNSNAFGELFIWIDSNTGDKIYLTYKEGELVGRVDITEVKPGPQRIVRQIKELESKVEEAMKILDSAEKEQDRLQSLLTGKDLIGLKVVSSGTENLSYEEGESYKDYYGTVVDYLYDYYQYVVDWSKGSKGAKHYRNHLVVISD